MPPVSDSDIADLEAGMATIDLQTQGNQEIHRIRQQDGISIERRDLHHKWMPTAERQQGLKEDSQEYLKTARVDLLHKTIDRHPQYRPWTKYVERHMSSDGTIFPPRPDFFSKAGQPDPLGKSKTLQEAPGSAANLRQEETRQASEFRGNWKKASQSTSSATEIWKTNMENQMQLKITPQGPVTSAIPVRKSPQKSVDSAMTRKGTPPRAVSGTLPVKAIAQKSVSSGMPVKETPQKLVNNAVPVGGTGQKPVSRATPAKETPRKPVLPVKATPEKPVNNAVPIKGTAQKPVNSTIPAKASTEKAVNNALPSTGNPPVRVPPEELLYGSPQMIVRPEWRGVGPPRFSVPPEWIVNGTLQDPVDRVEQHQEYEQYENPQTSVPPEERSPVMFMPPDWRFVESLQLFERLDQFEEKYFNGIPQLYLPFEWRRFLQPGIPQMTVPAEWPVDRTHQDRVNRVNRYERDGTPQINVTPDWLIDPILRDPVDRVDQYQEYGAPQMIVPPERPVNPTVRRALSKVEQHEEKLRARAWKWVRCADGVVRHRLV